MVEGLSSTGNCGESERIESDWSVSVSLILDEFKSLDSSSSELSMISMASSLSVTTIALAYVFLNCDESAMGDELRESRSGWSLDSPALFRATRSSGVETGAVRSIEVRDLGSVEVVAMELAEAGKLFRAALRAVAMTRVQQVSCLSQIIGELDFHTHTRIVTR